MLSGDGRQAARDDGVGKIAMNAENSRFIGIYALTQKSPVPTRFLSLLRPSLHHSPPSLVLQRELRCTENSRVGGSGAA